MGCITSVYLYYFGILAMHTRCLRYDLNESPGSGTAVYEDASYLVTYATNIMSRIVIITSSLASWLNRWPRRRSDPYPLAWHLPTPLISHKLLYIRRTLCHTRILDFYPHSSFSTI